MSPRGLKTAVKLDSSPAVQTQRFALSFARLLRGTGATLDSFGFQPLQDYPRAKKILVGRDNFCINDLSVRSLPYINLVIAKHVTRVLSLLGITRYLISRDCVFIHGLHLPYLLIGQICKIMNVPVGLILTDEQGIILPTDGKVRRVLKRVDGYLAKRLTRNFDIAVALSVSLAEAYMEGKPALVVPGFYDEDLENKIRSRSLVSQPTDRKFTVLYCGGLSAEYGVDLLIEAAELLPQNIEIRLFGRGPLEKSAQDASSRIAQLYYGGFIDHSAIVDELANCDATINARPFAGRLAAMSSPSKFMEYAAAAKPILSTPLPTIDREVMAKCIIMRDLTPSAIANRIGLTASMSRADLLKQGHLLQEAVRKRYSLSSLSSELGLILTKLLM